MDPKAYDFATILPRVMTVMATIGALINCINKCKFAKNPSYCVPISQMETAALQSSQFFFGGRG